MKKSPGCTTAGIFLSLLGTRPTERAVVRAGISLRETLEAAENADREAVG